MTSIPTNFARVPSLLSSQIMLGAITRSNVGMLNTQLQLSSGLRINRPSDDPIGASAVSVIDDLLERRSQRLRNLSHAEAVLNNVDGALDDATRIMHEAREIGLSQIGAGSDADIRRNQAQVIDAMLREMFSIANRSYLDVHLFGGGRVGAPPYVESLDGIRYAGDAGGFITDLGLPQPIALTLAGDRAFGATSSRVEGDRDLDPTMTAESRLADLNGTQGFGIRLSTININVNGTNRELDLTSAETVGDVAALIENFFAEHEPAALGPDGVRIDPATGNRFEIDLNAGFTVSFSDLTGGHAAADLGLAAGPFENGINSTGADVDPRITELTTIAQLTGVSSPLGSIRITNAGRSVDLDLSGVNNIRELMNAVAGVNLGVRVEIAATGDRLNFINELSGPTMSIGEVGGGATATELGVRSLAGSTLLADFNLGRGVQIISGSVDPATGAPDPSRDVDFRVTVKDGRSFDVDLVGAQTVQDVLDAINAAAADAGITVPGEFEAALAADGNGIALTDNTAGAMLLVERRNGSFAASDLGILGSTDGATLIGEDRATVAVESVFTHLMRLRDALEANDDAGIQFATMKLEADVDRLARARAEAGVRAQRVSRMTFREEDLRLQDLSIRSEIADLDFADAAVRLGMLQTQLQAALSTTSRSLSMSLIDFLR